MMFISVDKRNKKERKEYYSERRKTWGSIKPCTRVHSSKKPYKRNKRVEWEEELQSYV